MAGDSEQIGQDEIEKLLSQAKSAAGPAPQQAAAPAPDASTLAQGDIEALLKQNAAGGASASQSQSGAVPASQAAATQGVSSGGNISNGDIDLLFRQAEQALASINASAPTPPDMKNFKLVEFKGATANAESATLDLLRDVELDLKIELGRTHMYLEDILKLNKGAVVPLDRLAGDPVDIFVNGRLIARGEVLILNDNFCVRIAELVAVEQQAVA
jgi:flagellar motor switch protein FliN/FliY